VLRKFLAPRMDRPPIVIEEDSPRTGRALIERKNEPVRQLVLLLLKEKDRRRGMKEGGKPLNMVER
jgi:hypothetical protein